MPHTKRQQDSYQIILEAAHGGDVKHLLSSAREQACVYVYMICVYIYIYICIYICIYMCAYMYTYMYLSLYISLSRYICIYTYISLSLSISLYISLSLYIYIYTSISLSLYGSACTVIKQAGLSQRHLCRSGVSSREHNFLPARGARVPPRAWSPARPCTARGRGRPVYAGRVAGCPQRGLARDLARPGARCRVSLP